MQNVLIADSSFGKTALLNIPLNTEKAHIATAGPEVTEHFIQLNLK